MEFILAMDMAAVLGATALIAGVGLLIGILLGLASMKFHVEVDEKEIQIREELPGNNCGGCGFAGCDALAAAIAKGEAPAGACPVGGAAVAEKIAAITGAEAEVTRKVAFVKCTGKADAASKKYEYTGNIDCRQANYVTGGGDKGCIYGCLGYGSCTNVCDFDAIHVVNGVALVNRENCVACGKCVGICPKNLIELIPYEAKAVVGCSSKEKGKDVKAVCNVGCIGCGMCARNCPANAIILENNIAYIDQEVCIGCGLCKTKCPVKVIK